MSDVPVWSFFAYMTGDADGEHDELRNLADWQLEDVLRWATTRGYDNIYLSRDPVKTTEFKKASPVPGIVHHLHPRSRSGTEQQQTEGRPPAA